MKNYLTEKQVAKMLNLSPVTLQFWRRKSRGKIEKEIIGPKWCEVRPHGSTKKPIIRYDEEVVREWIENTKFMRGKNGKANKEEVKHSGTVEECNRQKQAHDSEVC